jgi:hypothetical protein
MTACKIGAAAEMAVSALNAALQDADEEVRKTVARSLDQIKHAFPKKK